LDVNKKGELVNFGEKRKILVNAGYYILDSRIFDYIKGNESFEEKTIPRIIKSKRIKFISCKTKAWYPLDTLQDKIRIKNQFCENKK